MHAVIVHTINDAAKWEEGSRRIMSMIDQRRLPKGLTAVQYLPSTDGRRAVCVWECDSLSSVKEFMDRETRGAARNDYFELNVPKAINLPKAGEVHLEKAA